MLSPHQFNLSTLTVLIELIIFFILLNPRVIELIVESIVELVIKLFFPLLPVFSTL